VVDRLIEFVGMLIALGLAAFVIFYSHSRSSFYRELFELEEAFEGELDFIHLSKKILAQVLAKTAAFGGILYWFDDAQQEYKIRTLLGIATEKINLVTTLLREPQGLLEQAQTLTASCLIRDLNSRREGKKLNNIDDLKSFCRSLMVIPLPGPKIPRGLIVIFGDKGKINAKYLPMMDAFAPRATVKLDNARLYQFAKETALENTRLYLNISKLYKQATLDELTGLYNRNFFMQRIKEEVKKAWRLKLPLSLIFVDLDHFKKVNDQFGHQVGDQLLMEFGKFLKLLIRDYDIPCRFGGEEFIVLLPHTLLDNAVSLAERLRENLTKHEFTGVIREFHVTASFGVSALNDFPEALAQIDDEKVDSNVDMLIARADDALYRAKNAGRNQVKTAATGLK
jgi:diguanylate cyclase (GGDEF)-like protein